MDAFQLPPMHKSQWIAFTLALLGSLFLTPFVRDLAFRLGLVARGGERHMHDTPTPRLGGVAIYVSCLLTSLLFVILYGRYTPTGFDHFELFGILVGSTVIFLLGLCDDIWDLSPKIKLIVQLAAAVMAWFCNVKITYVANPMFFFHLSDVRVLHLNDVLSFLLTVGWLILITNALNLIDGLDGLAGGVVLITAVSLWAVFIDEKILQPAGAMLVATMAGAVLGFLRSNYNPALIFLGDSGAYFLGFALGATTVSGLSGNPNTATVGLFVLICFSFPLADTAFAIARRILHKRSIMSSDADHIHHKILKAGLSTKATTFIIYGTCLLLGLVVCKLTGAHKRYIVLALMMSSLAVLNAFWRRSRDDKQHDHK